MKRIPTERLGLNPDRNSGFGPFTFANENVHPDVRLQVVGCCNTRWGVVVKATGVYLPVTHMILFIRCLATPGGV
jgi:hypothetical protein